MGEIARWSFLTMSALHSVKLPQTYSKAELTQLPQSRVLQLTSVQEEASLQMFVNTFGNCIFDSSKQRGPERWRILSSLIKMLLDICRAKQRKRKYGNTPCSYTFIHREGKVRKINAYIIFLSFWATFFKERNIPNLPFACYWPKLI